MEGLDSVFSSHHQPVRSVSLPSRIHPLSFKLRAALNRLKIWQRSSSSNSVSASFGSETLLVGLANLTELYGCVHEVLESPYVRHTLLHHQKGKFLEDALDGSVVLLDVCESSREMLVAAREEMVNLKSAQRRKGNVEKEVNSYVYLRKKAKKEISNHIIALKKMETKEISTNIDQDSAMASTSVLRETLEITISIFRHLLLFISSIPQPPSPSRKIKNTIGFLSIPFLSPFQDKSMVKGMKMVDSRRTFVEVEVMKKRDVVEDSFRDLETELDSVFKCLVKNRVLYLNILSNC